MDTASAADLLTADGDLPRRWTRETYRMLYLTLFGTEHGPPLRRVERQFGRADLVAAVRAYRERGERPLRDRVLAALRPEPEGGTDAS